MTALIHQRCHHHPSREAAARCPECARHFCRECVVEHEDRILCAACLRKRATVVAPKRNWFRPLLCLGAAACGFFALWVIFHLGGQLLLAVPSTFHEGTLWQKPFLGEP